MIDRIIEYSARNRFLVLLLVSFATAVGVWSLRRAPSTPSRTFRTCR